MKEFDQAICNVCFENEENSKIIKSTQYLKLFKRIFVAECDFSIRLCIWCQSIFKKINEMVNNYANHSKQKEKKLINQLSYHHNTHIDIPPQEKEIEEGIIEEFKREEIEDSELIDEDNKKEIIQIKNVKLKKELEDLNFEVNYLSVDEQKKEIEDKRILEKYKRLSYKCEHCGVGFSIKEDYEEHENRHMESAGLHVCEICKLRFKSAEVLSQHALAHRRRFTCRSCGTKFKRWSHCTTHRLKCGTNSAYAVCDVCAKIFGDHHSLKVHMKVHNNPKKYVCDHCKKTFGTKQRLKIHIRSHTGLRPFSCEACSRTFATGSNLRAHSSVHSNDRSYYCVECDKYYKTEKSLKRHFNEASRHVLDKGFSCKECTKKYSSENILQKHIKTAHLREHRCHHCLKGMTLRLAFAILSSACWSAFQHGYNTGVLNAPQEVMSEWLQLNALTGTNSSIEAKDDPKVTTVWSVVVSVYCVGGMIGGVITGVVADRFGRKGGLLFNNILVFVAALLQGTAKYANSAEMLIIGRLIIGINSGLNAGLAPLYLSEISPVSLRGSIGTVYQLVITMTILLSQVLGLGSVLGTAEGWPWLLAVTALPAALQCVSLPLCPESPKYLLLNKGRELHAQRALNWLRGDVAVHGEMEEMHQEAEKNKVSKKITLRELLVRRQLRQPLLIAIIVMVAQQLSGINAVIFFSTDIFRNVNLSESQSQYATLGMGAMNVVMTVISLLLVEIAGRKTLLLTGFMGMLVCTIALCVANLYTHLVWVSYACIALVILFVVMFAVGPGSIPWFLVTELFNQSSRPAASAVAVTVNWTANFIVGLSFLPLSLALGTYVFVIFAVLQLLFIMFIYFKVPETKNKTIEEITAMFRQQI